MFIFFQFIHSSRVIQSKYDQNSSVGRALHRHRRGHGFESHSSLNFFRLSFRNCLSCINNCEVFYLFGCIYSVSAWHTLANFEFNSFKIVKDKATSQKILASDILPRCYLEKLKPRKGKKLQHNLLIPEIVSLGHVHSVPQQDHLLFLKYLLNSDIFFRPGEYLTIHRYCLHSSY